MTKTVEYMGQITSIDGDMDYRLTVPKYGIMVDFNAGQLTHAKKAASDAITLKAWAMKQTNTPIPDTDIVNFIPDPDDVYHKRGEPPNEPIPVLPDDCIIVECDLSYDPPDYTPGED